MYLKKIYLENVGPIEKLVSKSENGDVIEGIELPFHQNGENAGNPKPLILVGQNGSGKSTILSFIVNAFFLMKQATFSNQDEIEKDRAFRVRSGIQIRSEATSYWADIEFKNSSFVKEFRSTFSEEDIKKRGDDDILRQRYVAAAENLGINHNFPSKEHQKDYEKGVFLYFPPNRFEEPIWLNSNSLNLSAKFEDPNKFEGETKRKIIQQSPLKEAKSWLMDLLLDEFNYESERRFLQLDNRLEIGVFPKKDGVGVNIRNSLNKFLGTFLGKEGVRTGFANRKSRLVQVVKDEQQRSGTINQKPIIPDLFAMSSGEVSLFCMFCAILRDADLAGLFDKKSDDSQWKNLGDIKGIVVIDEIELHLHTKMQSEILPKLIALFPKIQFIITTHSPLFMIGMETEFREENIKIVKLENGQSHDINSVYKWDEAVVQRELLKEKKLRRELRQNRIPEINKITEEVIVLTEGETDADYLKKALEFKRESNRRFLEKVAIEAVNKENGGIPALNAFYEVYKEENRRNKTIILLYDCDAQSDKKLKELKESEVNNLKIIIIPKDKDAPVEKGIENLFPSSLFEKREVKKFCSKTYKILSKGQENYECKNNQKIGAEVSDKTKLRDWICKGTNSSADDFKNFDQIFKMIEDVINAESSK